jgi:hypothetical protein
VPLALLAFLVMNMPIACSIQASTAFPALITLVSAVLTVAGVDVDERLLGLWRDGYEYGIWAHASDFHEHDLSTGF